MQKTKTLAEQLERLITEDMMNDLYSEQETADALTEWSTLDNEAAIREMSFDKSDQRKELYMMAEESAANALIRLKAAQTEAINRLVVTRLYELGLGSLLESDL